MTIISYLCSTIINNTLKFNIMATTKFYFFGKTDPYNARKYTSITGGKTHFFIKAIEGSIKDAENNMIEWAASEGDGIAEENDDSIREWKEQLEEGHEQDFSWYEGEGVYDAQCGYECLYKRGQKSYSHDIWIYEFKREEDLTDEEKTLIND